MAKKEDKRAYFKVDIGYLSNPKIAELMDEHPRAVLLHLQCIAYSAQHLTDGIVPMRLAMRLACSEQCDLDACVDAGLLHKVNATHLEVHDYLLHQRSAESVKGLSDQRKLAAQARWEADKADAKSNANRMQSAMQRKEREEREEKTSASTDVEREFAEWYALYPRKKAKADALKAYRAARKKADAETILAGLRRMLPELTSAAENFRPYPASWLRSESWEDEPSNVHALRTDDQGRPVLPPLPSRSPWGN